MTISSGVRPYEYVRYPFVLGSGELVGFSGILFEEPMYAINIDRRILSGSNPSFYKYVQSSLSPTAYSFYPDPSGANLSDRDTVVANTNFQDYITQTRGQMETMFQEILDEDTYFFQPSGAHNQPDASGILGIHLSRVPSHSGVGYTHQSSIGTSGQLYDIDIGELQWQPILRWSDRIWAWPMAPRFQDTTGNLITVDEKDLHWVLTYPFFLDDGSPASGYIAASGNEQIVGGDAIESGVKILMYDIHGNVAGPEGSGWECDRTFPRTTSNGGLAMIGGAGYFRNPGQPMTSGLKQMLLYNPNDDILPSSILGLYPHSGLDESIYNVTNGAAPGGSGDLDGYHVFDSYFAAIPLTYVAISVVSPLNGAEVWRRVADLTTYSATGTYISLTNKYWGSTVREQPTYNGSEYNAAFWAGDFPTASPANFEVAKVNYDSNFDYQSVTIAGPHSIQDGVSELGAPFRSFDASTHSPAGGTNISSYDLFSSWSTLQGRIYTAIWNGSDTYGCIRSGGVGFSGFAPVGVLNGEVFGNAVRYLQGPIIWQMSAIPATGQTIPDTVASLTTVGTWSYSANTQYLIVYDPSIAHDFEQPSQSSTTNFNLHTDGTGQIFQPKSDYDLGDGSAFLSFMAKRKGAASTSEFVGRVYPTTSGGEKQLKITEYWATTNRVPTHMLDMA